MDAYLEGIFLGESIERYKERFGYYPEAVLADSIYRTRENRLLCKSLGTRLSGPKLGRPQKTNREIMDHKRVELQDNADRNAIEGNLAKASANTDCGLIQVRLQRTSETVIALQFLVMNIEEILRDSFVPIFKH